mgnify:CR=1 FL=1
MGASLRRATLDVLKPRELDLTMLGKLLCELEGVERVEISVVEMDVRTETLKLTVEGRSVDLRKVHKLLEEHGCALRSVDALSFERRHGSTE